MIMYILDITRQHTNSLLALSLGILVFVHKIIAQSNDNWIMMEHLAEEYPFVVAVLNDYQQFLCTGSIIHSQAVLTSGECVSANPGFVAVAATVLSPSTVLNLLEVTDTVLHEDYRYYFNPRKPNTTKIISNIGLVIVKSHLLDKFVEPGVIADNVDLNLEHETLSVVGFTKTKNSTVQLIEFIYQQLPCHNPKWYNVFCGREFKLRHALAEVFAKGGPVLCESKIVGVVAAPSGALVSPNGVKFNVFTLTAPYLMWINSNLYFKSPPDSVALLNLKSRSYQDILASSFSETCALTKSNIIILSCIMNLLDHF